MVFSPSRKDKPQKSQRRANQRHYARESLVKTHMKLKGQVASENRRLYEAKARKLLKNVISERKLVSFAIANSDHISARVYLVLIFVLILDFQHLFPVFFLAFFFIAEWRGNRL